MAFPTIQHCIVCELARAEDGGKVTILGFLGVSPFVKFGLKDPKSASPLTFLFLAGSGEGKFEISFELRGEVSGLIGKRTPTIKVEIERDKPAQFIVQFVTAYPRPDIYHVSLLANGKECGSAQFEIMQPTS